MKKTTIKDVARLAKVSEATVSRVMSNSSLISDTTKEKVMKAVKELDYYPNSAAVSLTKNFTKIIGVVIENLDSNPLQNDFFTEIMSHISRYALKRDYYLLYINSRNDEENRANIEKLIKSNRIDGLIFLNFVEEDRSIKYLEEKYFPYVVLGTPKSGKGLWVDNNNVLASYLITKEYLEKGYKKIAFLSGPSDLAVSNYRKKGYLDALNEKGIYIEIKNILSSEFDITLSENLIENFLKENDDIEGIITTDDILAIGALRAIEKSQKRIFVTGFNNTKLRKYLKYNFLTVDIKYEQLAKSAINLLIDRIENIELKKNFVTVDVEIVREN